MISWWRTSFGDREVEKLRESVQKECIGQGLVTEEFEEEISLALNVPFVVATTNGSAALYMALLSLGIGHGDEVIIPNRTWIASANAILLTGAKVVLVDVRSDLPLIDVAKIQSKITTRTEALMPIPCISTDLPFKWTGINASVRVVIFDWIFATSISGRSDRTSTSTTLAPVSKIALADAIQVRLGIMTSSP
jgi:hypothetical protein